MKSSDTLFYSKITIFLKNMISLQFILKEEEWAGSQSQGLVFKTYIYIYNFLGV